MTLLVSPDRCPRCNRALVFDLVVGGGPWRCPELGPILRPGRSEDAAAERDRAWQTINEIEAVLTESGRPITAPLADAVLSLVEEVKWLRQVILEHVGTDAENVDPDHDL